jgi:hypothetical protein
MGIQSSSMPSGQISRAHCSRGGRRASDASAIRGVVNERQRHWFARQRHRDPRFYVKPCSLFVRFWVRDGRKDGCRETGSVGIRGCDRSRAVRRGPSRGLERVVWRRLVRSGRGSRLICAGEVVGDRSPSTAAGRRTALRVGRAGLADADHRAGGGSDLLGRSLWAGTLENHRRIRLGDRCRWRLGAHRRVARQGAGRSDALGAASASAARLWWSCLRLPFARGTAWSLGRAWRG